MTPYALWSKIRSTEFMDTTRTKSQELIWLKSTRLWMDCLTCSLTPTFFELDTNNRTRGHGDTELRQHFFTERIIIDLWNSLDEETVTASSLKFGQYIQRVHPNKSPLKFLETREHGRIQSLPNFFGYPQGTGKGTDFKFGQYIQRVHPNKSPLKILEKRERGRIQGLPKFFGYPLLSREREKLRISNLVRTFTGCIRRKAHWKFRRKWSVGVSRDCPIFLDTPYYLRNG